MPFWKENNEERMVRMVKEMLGVVKTAERAAHSIHELGEGHAEFMNKWAAGFEEVAKMAHLVVREIEQEEHIMEEVKDDLADIEGHLQLINKYAHGASADKPATLKSIDENIKDVKETLETAFHSISPEKQATLRAKIILKQLQHMYEVVHHTYGSLYEYQVHQEKKSKHVDDVVSSVNLMLKIFHQVIHEMATEAEIEEHVVEDLKKMYAETGVLAQKIVDYDKHIRISNHGHGTNVNDIRDILVPIEEICVKIRELDEQARKKLSN